jgi:hypothetical protein
MCQEDVLKILIEESRKDITKWFSMIEIERLLIAKKYSLTRFSIKVNRLYAYGFLDVIIPDGDGTLYQRRKFRPKMKYLINEERDLFSI